MSRRPALRMPPRGRKLLALGFAALTVAVLVALSFSHGTEQVLRWVKEHWLNSVAVTAWGTMLLVAAALAPFLIRWIRRRGRGGQAGDRAARERRLTLRAVRYQWIAGFLEDSLAGAA
jgi:hypothetical protein